MDVLLSFVPILGRFLFGFFFVFFGGWNTIHWRPTLDAMRQKKIPLANLLLWFGIFLETLSGLMIIFGVYVRLAALLLIPFVLVSIIMFHPFWRLQGEIRMLNMFIFITHITATLGALLLFCGGFTSQFPI